MYVKSFKSFFISAHSDAARRMSCYKVVLIACAMPWHGHYMSLQMGRIAIASKKNSGD